MADRPMHFVATSAVARSSPDGVAVLCTSGSVDDVMFAHNAEEYATRNGAYTETDSTRGCTDLTPGRILKLTHQGQHGTGGEV